MCSGHFYAVVSKEVKIFFFNTSIVSKCTIPVSFQTYLQVKSLQIKMISFYLLHR